ncbi:MAG: phage major capsid protein [Proteobacteria bacterium]|nr:MAG: phage major capsid protein [Pseudomonadota bacterium]
MLLLLYLVVWICGFYSTLLADLFPSQSINYIRGHHSDRSTLLGYPVEIDEAMPTPTAGNLAIAFGNFAAGYLINDRIGTRILRDPYTNKPYVMFYVTKRVGGGVLDPYAIRLLRVAA